jgi:threonine dehydrogenase-like Zn-dependent dehydrogenase
MPTWGLVALPLHGSDLDRTVLRYGFYVEALAVARSGIDKARGEAVQPRRAAVVGVGGIGLPALFWLTQWEGTEVFAFDRKPSDSAVAAAAKQFGVTYVRSGDMGALSGSFDYVVEAAGNPQALRLSLELLGPQGRLTYLSLPPEASSVEIPGDLLKQATLNGLRIDFSVGFGMAHLRAAAEALPRFCAALGPNLLERLTYPIAFSELSDEAIETAQRQTGGAKLYIRMQE